MDALSLYDTAELLQLIETVFEPEQFLVNRFFPTVHESTTTQILFDRFTENESIAPFVSPNVAGRPMRREGRFTDAFRPAYVKPKMTITPDDAFRRAAGEQVGVGTMSAQERFDIAVMMGLQKQLRSIERRLEWMAASALTRSSVTVVGDGYPSVTVDFARNPSHTIELLGDDAWSNPNVEIGDDLEDWSMLVLEATGAAATDVIMTPDVWRVLMRNSNFRELFKTFQSLGGSLPGILPAVQKRNLYKGQFGSFHLWVYQDWSRDEDGVKHKYMPPGTVTMVAAGETGVAGVQAFGAIQDIRALQPMRWFPKMFEQDDPSALVLLTQSAPLLIPVRPDATVSVQVLPPADEMGEEEADEAP
ncbi:major capsid protein [Paraburkholderia tuberum]|uniref:Phage major capsid protein E n=1 Tax=Paraburkholderia tuberum TaxID=157910 RepID=A0A1H1JTD5_9BURK|nr:major capsid protein [Paraburkholderia tuberum]SDR52885.1 Phage major capsid protein E [Paraburkholderia tuberum]